MRLNLTDPLQNLGRVEVAIAGHWGTICNSMWDDRDARVVCRQLNYTDGVSAWYGNIQPGAGPIWLRYEHCTTIDGH